MPSSIPVINRMNARVEELSTNLEQCVQTFAIADRFSGPSLHFHRRVIDFRSECSVAEAVNSDEFLELLYAALTAWGMHRMGPGNTKLRDLQHITQALRAHAKSIHRLEDVKLTSLAANELQAVATDIWQLIDVLEVSLAEAKIVANRTRVVGATNWQ